LQNQQAARYARWAAWAAAAIALVVVGVFAKHAIQEARARHFQPKPIASAVEQQSNEFSFSKIDQNVTIFTVRAAKATEYKEQNQMVLQDVWITIFGRSGDRNDNIHTSECSYQPKEGSIHCQGAVQIDLASKNLPAQTEDPKSIQITTSNLSFNKASGEASTPEPVEFRFAQGHGHAVGVTYSTETAVVVLQQNVTMELNPSQKSGGPPISATGGSLVIHRNERRVELMAPAEVKQGSRVLDSQQITIELDENFKAQRAVAEGHPTLRSSDPTGEFSASANQFEAALDPAGWIQRIAGDGAVTGMQRTRAGTNHFAAAKVSFDMEPEHNAVKTMNATGGVAVDSADTTGSRALKTEALLVRFAAATPSTSRASAPAFTSEPRRIESAETLAPATIEMKSGNEATTLRAKRFVTRFNTAGKLDQLLGHLDVQITRQIGASAPQVTTSAELAASFDSAGQWSTLDQSGNVKFQQNDRQATAATAHVVRATDMITLTGSPVLSDAMSRTSAGNVVINQRSGEIQATGGVLSTYLSGAKNTSMNLGDGPGHVSSDKLTGSNTTGHAVYSGHARLWQGDSVLDAQQIELWRDEKKMQATGGVVAVFQQASGPGVASFGTKPARGESTKPSTASGPTLWHIRAPMLTYWSDAGRAHLETGVRAESQQGSMDSKTLDVYLTPPPAAIGAPTGRNEVGAASGAPAGASGGNRQMDKALAQGAVIVRQGDRRATAEQALYSAADGKFILSGGQPTIIDASSDTTTGHSLTFFVANDTILIDSQEGSRTLTKHRVEK
jgi:lipopolysaccharide export system protein LptA